MLGVQGGYTIANGTTIDNAIGGTGNDTFYANSDADTFIGNGGSDTVVFSGLLANYLLADPPDDVITVTTDGATDTLVGITTLQFADQSILASSIECFVAGTRLATPCGEVAVEDLVIGDFITVCYGGTADQSPIKWIGSRRIDCHRCAKPSEVWPVRIRAAAFGAGKPHRDLWLSPDHSIFLRGALIPVKYLINDSSITQEPLGLIRYFHVELEHHAIVLAEGLPCESYLDTGKRQTFESVGRQSPRHTQLAEYVRDAFACAEFVVTGTRLEFTRRVLLDQTRNSIC